MKMKAAGFFRNDTFQKILIFMFIAVKISNFTIFIPFHPIIVKSYKSKKVILKFKAKVISKYSYFRPICEFSVFYGKYFPQNFVVMYKDIKFSHALKAVKLH
jgi:hypothetical protein